MCAVIGALVWNLNTDAQEKANRLIHHIITKSVERGKDGFGYSINSNTVMMTDKINGTMKFDIPKNYFNADLKCGVLLSNLRAEPTTEFVRYKQPVDQQPYQSNGWSIVHNGTIANDKKLRTYAIKTRIDSAAIAEQLGKGFSYSQFSDSDPLNSFAHFYGTLQSLEGSFAILANVQQEPDRILVGVNYKPVWYVKTHFGIFFASSRSYFPEQYVPKMLEPYTAHSFSIDKEGFHNSSLSLNRNPSSNKALVICSGGLDSVVAACLAKIKLGYDITLLHFEYGCRAETNEVDAIKKVAKSLDVPYRIFPLPIYDKTDSPLFDHNEPIAFNEGGAEYAHEWVPARNLVLLSVATAYAEANGFETLILGNNLEESSAYPDNEPEFVNKFNDVLPFAIGDGKRMKVVMPVGNMMKHEIVKAGYEVGAPMGLTWSCYYKGEKHCGRCGPCFMRRTAFEINNLNEVIEYAHN